jgi:hypothetical protein
VQVAYLIEGSGFASMLSLQDRKGSFLVPPGGGSIMIDTLWAGKDE